MRRLLALFFLSFLSFSAEGVFAQTTRNTTCPVMGGERTKEKFYFDYQGKRIYFCCRPCVKAFKKNPGKYLKRLRSSQHD